MSAAIGAIIGPPMGGAICDATSFRFTTDVFAMVAFVFALIYFVVAVMPTYFLKDPATKGNSKVQLIDIEETE